MAQPELKRGLMLRNRIVLGLAPIFILLIAMGIYAVSLFAKLGGAIDVILRENFRSVLAAQNMKEAAERMDSALFFSLVGEEQRGRRMYEQNLPIFRDNLNVELHNITLPGEKELAEKIESLHRPLRESSADVLEFQRSGPAPANVFRRDVADVHRDQGDGQYSPAYQSGCDGEGRSRCARPERADPFAT